MSGTGGDEGGGEARHDGEEGLDCHVRPRVGPGYLKGRIELRRREGEVAKWQGRGLQNLHPQFDSGRRLQSEIAGFRTAGTLAGMGLAQIKMPQLGESVTEGTVDHWLKNEGDFVKRDEPLVEVITDKVNAEIPSPFEGKLVKITAAQ